VPRPDIADHCCETGAQLVRERALSASELRPRRKIFLKSDIDYRHFYLEAAVDRRESSDPLNQRYLRGATKTGCQAKQAVFEPNLLNKTGGPVIHVRDLPRRSVGEVVVISTTPTTSTGMVVFAMESVHLGDDVELDQP
jgi:hypothetical protein